MSGRYWSATDEDGDCSRCGLSWSEEELAGDARHECPPGFWKRKNTEFDDTEERAAFEGNVRKRFCELKACADEALKRDEEGRYVRYSIWCEWYGWRARAIKQKKEETA